MSEIYRLAGPEDAGEPLEVISGAYQSIRDLNIEFRAVHADLEMVRSNIQDNHCYVLQLDGAIAATISLKLQHDASEFPFLYWFAVHPRYANQGIGSRLLSFVEKRIVRDVHKAQAVTLATSKKHPWSASHVRKERVPALFRKRFGNRRQADFSEKGAGSRSRRRRH
ncbi:GNAT family N-acetyltransferase [Paenibacillus sp. P26]|nr:GNAT family N-acetyltransferase [Paenibacillus sp. P26]UUZ93729.1 GNAT family N-acetyltransferase [Paenibacillus sp. P25]